MYVYTHTAVFSPDPPLPLLPSLPYHKMLLGWFYPSQFPVISGVSYSLNWKLLHV